MKIISDDDPFDVEKDKGSGMTPQQDDTSEGRVDKNMCRISSVGFY